MKNYRYNVDILKTILSRPIGIITPQNGQKDNFNKAQTYLLNCNLTPEQASHAVEFYTKQLKERDPNG